MGIEGSKLKYDLCFKRHMIEESSGDCGEEYEDRYNYFMDVLIIQNLNLNSLMPFPGMPLHVTQMPKLNPSWMEGQTLGLNENFAIINAVHNFIIKSDRFQ